MSPILYNLKKSQYKTRPEVVFARIIPQGVANSETVLEEMTRRGTTFSKTDLMGALHLYEEVVLDLVSQGYHVHSRLFKAKPSIKGNFKDLDDQFNASRHTLSVSLSKGNEWDKRLKAAKVQKKVRPPVRPQMVQFLDVISQTRNQKITPGGIGELRGLHLKFNPDGPGEGIFLLNEATGESHKVQHLASIEPKKLVFLIPNLVPGTYQLEVKTSLAGGTDRLKTANLSHNLTIE
jgi:hypothetical protein